VWPVFLIWLYRKLWKSSSLKLLVEFQNNFTEMILGWTATKVVQRIMICQKTWPPGVVPVFLIQLYRKVWKSFSSKLLVQFQNNFTEMIPGWTSAKIVHRILICPKTWPPGAWPVFLIWLYRKLWKSFSPKLLVWFQNSFIEMILGWTFTKVVQKMMISQKTWPPGAGPVFLIHLYLKDFLWWFFCSPFFRWAI